MILTCSSYDMGIPAGDATAGSSRSACCSAIWMRRSISRTDSRYSSSFRRSDGARPASRLATLPMTASRMLRCRSARARAAPELVLPTSPNNRSKTRRGFVSRGIGVVRLAHELLRYAQLKPPSHVATPYTVSPPSIESSNEGIGVSRPRPAAVAAIWSIDVPSSSADPVVRLGRAPVRKAPAA